MAHFIKVANGSPRMTALQQAQRETIHTGVRKQSVLMEGLQRKEGLDRHGRCRIVHMQRIKDMCVANNSSEKQGNY